MISVVIFYAAVAGTWVFVIWVLWMIVQSLKGIDESLEQIASTFQDRSET